MTILWFTIIYLNKNKYLNNSTYNLIYFYKINMFARNIFKLASNQQAWFSSLKKGQISQVIGAVVDVQFEG